MKLLKVYFDHLRMFEDGIFDIDLYATDRVPAADESAFELVRPLYSQNVVALAGINASGKTTALNLLEFACRALDGRPIRGGGLPDSMPSLFDLPARMRCIVWHDGRGYLLDSVLDLDEESTPGKARMAFGDERLFRLPSKALKKSVLSSWDELESAAELVYQRSKVDDSWTVVVPSDISIAPVVIAKLAGQRCHVFAQRDGDFRLTETFEGIDEVLRVFDPRVVHLDVRDSGRAFSLEFEGREPVLLSEQGLLEVLSSGTVRGLGLVQRAMTALRTGGYLLVDEIENHLNRQLVNVVVDLFTSRETNPNGATVVFTTHYSQLLDHVHRKDNVYFLVRGASGGSQLVKYADRAKRIENKKSEVFASNYVKGTAPRYSDVRRLKSLVGEAVCDG